MVVQGAPIWLQQCPMYVHKVNETSSVHPETPGDQDDPLPGRHANYVKVQGEASETHGLSPETADCSGGSDKPQEECSDTVQGAGVLGVSPQLDGDDSFSP